MLPYRCVPVLILAFVALAWLPGCRCNPQFCADHPGNNCENPIDASSDGRERCTGNAQCTAPAGVCDVADTMTCVQCTVAQPAACTGTTPVCGSGNQCEACTAHAQCATSSACLPDGSCASQADVAYVAPPPLGTDNNTCMMMAPCTNVNRALQTQRRYVKFSGTTDEVDQAVSINNQDVILLADPSAQLTSTKNGILLELRGSSQVAIYDLEITGASGSGGIGISVPAGGTGGIELHRAKVTNNTAGGISVAAGSLTVSQSTIANNQGGGISVTNAGFVVVGNVFSNNGSDTTLFGGIAVGGPQNTMNRLELNSFNRNKTQDGLGTAIQCLLAGTFTARNNIMSDNGTQSNLEQVGGTCKHDYSIARPGTLPVGMNNTASDPGFLDPPNGDLHIQRTSPARHAADPGTDLTGITSHDIDGDLRVSPADIGADQVK